MLHGKFIEIMCNPLEDEPSHIESNMTERHNNKGDGEEIVVEVLTSLQEKGSSNGAANIKETGNRISKRWWLLTYTWVPNMG